MVQVVPFVPEHMAFIDLPDAVKAQAGREDPQLLAASREAWTWLSDDGEVLAVMGAVETHPRVVYVWTYLGKGAGRHAIRLVRWAAFWLLSLHAVRVEGTVIKNDRCGHRLMRLLGFKRETTRPMRMWDGYDSYHLYARVMG
jgi:hypothetical protein